MDRDTSELRAALEDAYDSAKAAHVTLRVQLRTSEKAARALIAGGSFAATNANRRQSQFADYGPGQITPKQKAECFRYLIDEHDKALAWLTWCAKYGLDPDQAELDRVTDPPGDPVVTPATIVDADVFEWLMGSVSVAGSTRGWPGRLIPITEVMSDYSGMRISGGMQWT